MVYVQGGDSPKMSHLTEREAQAEASRLCRRLGRDAFVLKAITKIKCVVPIPPLEITPLTEHYEDSNTTLQRPSPIPLPLMSPYLTYEDVEAKDKKDAIAQCDGVLAQSLDSNQRSVWIADQIAEEEKDE